MTITPKILLTDICKSFGSKTVLDGVNLDVNEGESLVVIGGSGTGKSVLIKCILGLMQPDKGSVQVDGEELTKLRRKERQERMGKFGMLFQGGALFDSLTVWENINFALLQTKQLNRSDAHDKAAGQLKEVGLGTEVVNLYPSELSGGMQKRVALARAIASNPEIIFFDEPTTGLDPIMADTINDLILSCTKERKLTTFSITHDMFSVRKIATRVAMIYQGKIIWHGPVEHLDNSGNPYVDQFVNGRAEGPITDEANAA